MLVFGSGNYPILAILHVFQVVVQFCREADRSAPEPAKPARSGGPFGATRSARYLPRWEGNIS